MMRKSLLCAALTLASCTFSTDANDRKVVPRLDFAMTLKDFTPHAEKQVDIVLASPADLTLPIPGPNDTEAQIAQRYTIRGRLRVLMPPAPAGAYPDVRVGLKKFIEPDWESDHSTMQVLFYADQNNDFLVEPFDATGLRNEHTWIKPLPENGELTFSHAANFQDFFDSEEKGIGGDLALAMTGQTPEQNACLTTALGTLMKESLEVRIIFNAGGDEEQQIAGFKMFAGTPVPDADIMFHGISDSSSTYLVQTWIDGKLLFSQPSSAATADGLTIPFAAWFPTTQININACFPRP